ncbi:MAG: fatty-acyl-CoA synthase [Blastococcus sp.]|jgi:fatty-acyl-CoA synthase|nr:fatty-acyl-CoA synthase [Blastococcus sp.]
MTATPPRLEVSYWPAEPSSGVRDITVGDLLREGAAVAPDRLALVDGGADPAARRAWTYVELLADVERVARALLARFEPGDRIAIWAPNAADWVVLQQGIAMAGMIMVAINPAYRSHELQYVLAQSGSVGLFYVDTYRDVALLPIVEEVRPRTPALREIVSFTDWSAFLDSGDPAAALPAVAPLDPVQIQYTSGTTGFPKGALLHHKGLVNEASFVAQRAGMGDGAVCINAMPMYHIGGGAVTEFATLSVHGTYVVVPGFDPGLVLELFETYRGTHSLMVPTMLIAILEHPDASTRDLSGIETMMSGASAVPEALVHRVMDRLGCRFTILFGQTEMHGVISQTRITDAPADQAATVGQPLPELEVKIAEPVSGEVMGLGEQGEICCRGYQNMLAYYELPQETAATVDAEGWLHMGDLGTMDDRGYLKVTGRLKDMIIRGGINIYPREIEDLLFSHEDIAEVAVIGVADERWGEQIAAVIRAKDPSAPPTPEALRAWCRERIAAHKVPSYWYFTQSYPMTPSGKVQKFVLRDQIDGGQLRPAAVPAVVPTA